MQTNAARQGDFNQFVWICELFQCGLSIYDLNWNLLNQFIFSRVHATLQPALSVGWLVGRSHFTFFYDFISWTSLLLPTLSSDLKYGPCPPARDFGSRVSGLVIFYVCIPLFPCLPMYSSLSLPFPVCFYLCLPLYLYISISFSLFLCMFLSLSLSFHVSPCLYVPLSLSLTLSLSPIFVSVSLPFFFCFKSFIRSLTPFHKH